VLQDRHPHADARNLLMLGSAAAYLEQRLRTGLDLR
jgi:hypothetical protein